MGIVGDHPEGGIRFDLERVTPAGEEGPPWLYTGAAFTHEAEHALKASVDAAGAVTVENEASLPKEVVQRAKLLLRTAYKHAQDGGHGTAPPRRIHPWRAG